MLTLITGLPGAGKTLNTLQLVESERNGRPVYYRGIRELKLDWTEISDDDCQNWREYPDGSIFVFDECQQVWPNIAHSKQSPPAVMQLDTHRHRGMDFYVITQQPTLIDFRLRKFVSRHLHFERAFGRNASRCLEWQQVESDPRDYHARQEAQITRVKFKKAFFEKYHSAEVHTHKPRIPRKAFLFGFAILFTLGAFVYAYNNIVDRAPVFDREEEVPQDNLISQSHPLERWNKEEHPETTDEYIARFTPRIDDIPFSAPAYDELLEVRTYPRPQCLLRVKTNVCKCYTQQATPLDISHPQCVHIVQNGWFNPFIDESEREAKGQALAPRAPSHSTRPQSAEFHGKTQVPTMTMTGHPMVTPEPRLSGYPVNPSQFR